MVRQITAATDRNRLSALSVALLTLISAIAVCVLAPSAQAAGNPDISLAKETDGEVLFGGQSTVTLTASSPSGAVTGYNLSLRDVLPAGVSYVAGSAPATIGEPRILQNRPTPGQTTLLWENVSDLTPNSSFDLTFRVAHDDSVLAVGDTYTNQAGAYLNCDARYVPDFNANGEPVQSGGNSNCTGTPAEQSYTGWATAGADTEINAIEIEKDEPSPEGELLRGLHNHQTVYTLTVRNNLVNPSNNLRVEDYLPAGLEYLGCGTADNTTNAPTNPGSAAEYPGSGPINPGNAPAAPDCVEPDIVETVQDPPGLPAGVYTHVVWENLGNMAASDEITIQYIAAIPVRENTMTWTGTVPATNGPQTANLDNNAGPETQDEQALTNYAVAGAEYQAPGSPALPVSDSTDLTRTAEDIRIIKAVSPDNFGVGVISEWTLQIDAGEYRYLDNVVVNDTLGNGYCPLGGSNYETTPPPADSECDPVAGEAPSHPYTTVDEQADGTWEITWDSSNNAALARIAPSTGVTITFPTVTRSHYQANFEDQAPVLARDNAGNDVQTQGDSFIICAPGAPFPCPPGDLNKIDSDDGPVDGQPDFDASAATQEGAGPSIVKQVSPTVNGACSALSNYGDTIPVARPGDTVCWRLTVTFPDNVETGGVTVTDFIPPGTTYEAGSSATVGAHDVGIDTPGDPEPNVSTNGHRLAWPLDDSGGDDAVGINRIFDLVFSVEVQRIPTSSDGDIVDNLMKVVYSNTAGQTFPLRDKASFEIDQPEIALVKGVRDINNRPAQGRVPNVDGGTVSGDDVVTYRIDVSNNGTVGAQETEVWDVLPSEIVCADVSAISNGGTCDVAEDRIVWSGLDVPAGESITLTYDVTMPDNLTAGETLVNRAGVRQFESENSAGDPYTNIPSNNIDPDQEDDANAPRADDPSNVTVEEIDIAKSRTTGINQPGNNLANQATIGEEIDYTVRVTIPAGTSLYGDDTALVDALGPRFTFVAGTAAATLDTDGDGPGAPSTLPVAGLSLTETATGVRIDFPNPYHNAAGSGDDVIVLTYTAKVADVYPENYAKGSNTQYTLPNVATLSWENQDGTDRSESASTNTTIVEPDVRIRKAADGPPLLTPGDVIDYRLVASNLSGTRVSQANGAVVVDTLPTGLFPVNGGTAVADGGSVDPDGGIWDETARTITWAAFDLAPGASKELRYSVEVDFGLVGASSLTNTAVVTTTSMPGSPAGEREAGTSASGYEDDDSVTGKLISAQINKGAAPGSATVGQKVNHVLAVVIPAGIRLYDTVVADDLPNGLIFDAYGTPSCSEGCTDSGSEISPATLGFINAPDGNGGQQIGWYLGDIEAHAEERTVLLPYTTYIADTYAPPMSGSVADGDSLTNTATLFFNPDDDIVDPPTLPPNPGDYEFSEDDEATTNVVEPTLILDKVVSGDDDEDDLRDTQPGDSYTYTIKVTNTGNAPAYDVVVTDQPDAELTNVDVATDAAWTITDNWTAADPDIAWLIPGPIGPNQTVTLSYTADLIASSGLVHMQTVENTADVPNYWGVPEDTREDNPDIDYREYDDVDPDTVELTVHLPDLVLEKTTGAPGNPDDAPAHIETAFDWRIVITNPNTPSSLLGVDLTDTLPPNWTYVPGSAYFSGTGTLTPGGQVDPTITEDDAGDVLVWENIANLTGGQTVIVEFQATPDVAAALNPGVETQHLNDAEAIGEDSSGSTESGDGPYSDDDDATATLERPDVDLAITKVARDKTPVAGTETIWDLVVTNNGPETSPSVQVSDVLPAGLTYVSAEPEQGSCAESPAGTVACDLGVIRSGDSVAIVLTTLVGADQNGRTLINPAEVTDPTVDESDPTNNDDDDEVTPKALADLSIEKSRLNEFVASQRGIYRLTVKNAGPSVAESVVVRDTLPANLSLVEARSSVGTCTATGQAIECDLGDMAPGAQVVIEVEVNILSGGETANSATVESPTPDPDPGNNEDGDTTNSNNTDLAIEKTGPVNFPLGVDRHYDLKVTNVGNTASGGRVTVTDWIPNVLAPLAAAGDGWTCGIAGQLVTCERGDSLAPGASFPLIKIGVTARKHLGFWPVTNTAEVSLPSDPNEANNRDSHTVERGAICTDGRLVLKPRFVWAGRQTRVVIRVVRPDRGPAAGVTVRLRGNGRDGAAKKVRTARSNKRGEVSFVVRATGRAARWVATVGPCGLKERIAPRIQPHCRAFQVNPRSVLPGRTSLVRVRLKAPDGGPLIGVQVAAQGPGVNAKARTNRKGLALLRVAPTGPGAITVSAPGAIRCAIQIGAADVGSAGDQLTG